MPAERLSMRRLREILRLKAKGRFGREIARSLSLSPTTVGDYLRRAKVAGIAWPLPPELDDEEALERVLFVAPDEQRPSRPLPDWRRVHTELRRKHVTLALLWEEYKSEHLDGYQYSQFCVLYRAWAKDLHVWMRQTHRGGEKLFVDYSGDGIPWTDPVTAKPNEAQLFVAVLGASNYTYAEATETQQLPDWLECHVHALEFLGGVPTVRRATRLRSTSWIASARSSSIPASSRSSSRSSTGCASWGTPLLFIGPIPTWFSPRHGELDVIRWAQSEPQATAENRREVTILGAQRLVSNPISPIKIQ